MNWNLLANFSIAIFAILNPLGKIPVWTELTGGDKAEIRNRVAALAVLTGMAVLLVFLVGGKQILIAFSIDMPSFRIAGGILVLLTAISMVKGNLVASPTPEETEGTVKEAARKRFQAIVVPLAVPMLEGLGEAFPQWLEGGQSIIEESVEENKSVSGPPEP
ncbi:hypothetical protein GF420_12920 [candidate division GN15 bacterium]|nr:hypothetical protein [candidate division GN15 bacterium]